MSHFAKVEEGTVTQVIVISQEEIDTGIWGDPSLWVKTSYNTHANKHSKGKAPLRKNFAAKGYSYDKTKDAFIPKKKYPSMLLDEDTAQWKYPVEYPTDGKDYKWNENAQSWDLNK